MEFLHISLLSLPRVDLSYLVGLVLGFLSGFISSLLANSLFDALKRRDRGSGSFLKIEADDQLIHFEGQFVNTNTSQTAIFKTFKASFPPNP